MIRPATNAWFFGAQASCWKTAAAPPTRGCASCPTNADEYPELTNEWKLLEVARAATEWIDCLTASHRDFAVAVLDGHPPLVDGEAGTRSVELANAIYLSSVEDRAVTLPLERGAYTPVFDELVTGGLAI